MPHTHKLPNGDLTGNDKPAADGRGHVHRVPGRNINVFPVQDTADHKHRVPGRDERTGPPLASSTRKKHRPEDHK